MTRTAEWCIDYVSPYPYLQMPEFADLPNDVEIKPVPVLFAGLLGHWGQLGPAEIPAKKLHTFHYSRWLADKRGLRLAGLARHPFNPLALLRLTIALGATLDVVRTIYDHTWADGGDGQSDESLAALADKLGVDDVRALVSTDEVKAQLRANTDRMIAAGVYGVPTLVMDGHLFWGDDSMPMFREYLDNPAMFKDDRFARANTIEVASGRPGKDWHLKR